VRILVDTDNALGSPRGDVDDALAVAPLLASGLPVAAVASVGGNTSEARADANNRRLGALCGYAYDLVAAACLFAPETVERVVTPARLRERLWIEWGAGERRVTLVRDCDGGAIWRRTVALINAIA
jgi:inosine-uridine nucleoside N-ribohydrolase